VSTGRAVQEFCAAAIEKGAEANLADHALFDRLVRAYRALVAAGPIGESAFVALLDHPSPYVRSWVAAQLAPSGNPDAARTLEILALEPGLVGLDAATTLRELRAGRLRPPLGESAV
jgi:hypothetical protein